MMNVPSHSLLLHCYFLTHKALQYDSHAVTTELHEPTHTHSKKIKKKTNKKL